MIAAGVIGWPVAHSKSPLIHRFWLAKLGLDGDYGRFAVAPERLGEAMRALPALGLRGVNVTVPHKVTIMKHLDRVDPLAAGVGAVNTVVVEDGKLVGYNSDVAGFVAPLRDMLNQSRRPTNHVATHLDLIGTGGAARAVAYGWQTQGSDLTVYGRDATKADRLVAEFGRGGVTGGGLSIADLSRATVHDPASLDMTLHRGEDQRYRYVVVNATTLGMPGQPGITINLDWYPDDTIVYDLVYAPLETPLLAAARARGLRTIDGLAMLIGQAAAAFALFFDAAAPRKHDAELRALLAA